MRLEGWGNPHETSARDWNDELSRPSQMNAKGKETGKPESMETMAARIADEVKHPLQVILCGLRHLADQVPVAHDTASTLQTKMVLQDMRSAVTRVDAIVQGLVAFSVTQQVERTEHDLNSVVEASLRLVNYELTHNEIAVAKNLATDLPRMTLDRVKMEQVFIHLFMNAIQAMPHGGTLSVKTVLDPGPTTSRGQHESPDSETPSWPAALRVEIEDTGKGVPEEVIANVFDPFFTTKPMGQGTGLGLTVVKNIVGLHGGTVELRNRPIGGVGVTIRLPSEKPIVGPNQRYRNINS